MQFPSSPTESLITQLLSEGPKSVSVLIASAVRSLGVTQEAVYLAIRNLKKKRIIVVTKKTASLYVFWIQNMLAFSGRVESSYRSQYPELITFSDVFSSSFRSKTFPCPTFDDLENTFHHIAQSLIKPQDTPTPYFFFGFAPWWMTLWPQDADVFVKRLVAYNYIPLMVFNNQFAVDKATVIWLRKLGCQIIFVNEKELPFGFEGHYVDGFCLEALHPMKQYPSFFKEYSRSKLGYEKSLADLVRQFKNGKIRLSKKKNPFSRRVLDQFAVRASFFKGNSGGY